MGARRSVISGCTVSRPHTIPISDDLLCLFSRPYISILQAVYLYFLVVVFEHLQLILVVEQIKQLAAIYLEETQLEVNIPGVRLSIVE